MKRRKFITSLAALSLAVSEAWAAKKQSSGKSSGKSESRSSGSKSSSRSNSSGSKSTSGRSSGRGGSSRNSRQFSSGNRYTYQPQAPVAHTAEDPVIERPPQGTSATKLPPVKAQEPPSEWRTFEITTTVTLKNAGTNRLWLPLPLNQDTLFQRTLGHTWEGNPNQSSMRRQPDGLLETLYCEWRDGGDGRLQIRTQVTTADRHFDITKRTIAPEREDILRRNLQASQLIPNDGLAYQLGERILGRIKDPVAQAKAIYDWVVDNSVYDPSINGCGTGDVRQQLVRGLYGGRSADINGLFVAICRAVGIPARCVYGLRVGPSRLFRNLGLNGDDATRAQHVRAEFYIPGYGWIPVDPSDVRRTIALEGISDRDSRLQSLRRVLFGVWEMNWIALNVGSDIVLPGRQLPQPFLLYPQLEAGTQRIDGINPANIQYSIKARQIAI